MRNKNVYTRNKCTKRLVVFTEWLSIFRSHTFLCSPSFYNQNCVGKGPRWGSWPRRVLCLTESAVAVGRWHLVFIQNLVWQVRGCEQALCRNKLQRRWVRRQHPHLCPFAVRPKNGHPSPTPHFTPATLLFYRTVALSQTLYTVLCCLWPFHSLPCHCISCSVIYLTFSSYPLTFIPKYMYF